MVVITAENGKIEYGDDRRLLFTVYIEDIALTRQAVSNGEQFLERLIPGCSTVVTNSGEDGVVGVEYGVTKEKEGFETQRDRADDEVWVLRDFAEEEESLIFTYAATVGDKNVVRAFEVVVTLSGDKLEVEWNDNPVLLTCMEMTDLVAPLFCFFPMFRKKEKTQMEVEFVQTLEEMHKYLNRYDPALYPNKANQEEAEVKQYEATL